MSVRATTGLPAAGLALLVGAVAALHVAVPRASGRSAAVCSAPRAYPAPSPDRPRYWLKVDLQPARRLASGGVRVAFVPDLPTARLVFRLWPNAPFSRRAGARLTVSHAALGRRPLLTRQPDPTTLVAPLPQRLAPGKRVVVSLSWRLRLPRGRPDRFDSAAASIRLGSFFPLLAWEPGRGWALDPPPQMPAESATSPAADFDLQVSAPAGLRVFATGTPVGRAHWRARAVRDVAVAAGRFAVASRTVAAPRPVRVVVAVQTSGGGTVPRTASPFARSGSAGQFLARVARALPILARLYGPYPWPSLTAVVQRDLAPTGGIEYPMLVFLGYRSLLTAVAHETAHQWFYSLVGNDQGRDPWLDEGLATWGQTQVDPDARPYFLQRFVPRVAKGRLGAPIVFWNAHQAAYGAGVYAQGVQALAAVGSPERVNCALRRYVARNAYRIATPRRLVGELERAVPGARRTLARYGVRA